MEKFFESLYGAMVFLLLGDTNQGLKNPPISHTVVIHLLASLELVFNLSDYITQGMIAIPLIFLR